ncbi:MAG: beta-galactosidase trimerization domain-containing protein [bacterium]
MSHWWQRPLRMMRWDYMNDFSQIKGEDLDSLVRMKKEKLHINCEWIVGTPGISPGLGYLTTFNAEGFDRYPGFEDFDSLRSYLPYARKYGIRLLVYLNMHWFSYKFAEDHPGWEQIMSNGEPYGKVHPLYGNGTTFCVNSSWRDWAFKLIEETMKTGVDGVFLDGPVIYPDCCYCESCQKKFKGKYGKDIPKEDWQDPLWKTFIEFREDSMVDFLRDAKKVVSKINPEGVIFLNAGSWQPGSWRVARDAKRLSRYQNFSLAEAFFHPSAGRINLYQSAITTKYLRATGIPVVTAFHYCMGPWHYTFLNPEEIKLSIFQAISCNGNVWIGGSTYRHEYNPEGCKPLNDALGFLEENEDYLVDLEPLSDTALLFSSQTARYYISNITELYKDLGSGREQDLILDLGTGKTVIDWSKRKLICENLMSFAYEGYFTALTRNHIMFDIILDEDLSLERLSKYKVLVIPDFACLSDRQWREIEEFVREGGSLITSFDAGLYDEKGEPNFTEKRLRLLGIREIEGVFPAIRGENYIIAKEDIFGFNKENLIERSPYALKVKALEGAHTPFFFMNPLERVYTALKGESSYPAVIINSYGRGRVIYFAFPIGTFYGSERIGTQEQLIKSSINYSREPMIRVSGPPTVEVELYRQKNTNRLILFLVNNTGDMQRPISYINPANNIEISIRDSSIKNIYSVSSRTNIRFKRINGNVSFMIPLLKEFDIIKLEEV